MTSPDDTDAAPPTVPEELIGQAREVAMVGDRWFLSVVGGMGRMVSRARDGITGGRKCPSAAIRVRPRASADTPSSPELDVLSAIPAGAASPNELRRTTEPDEDGSPAGVLPVLRALGSLLTDHMESGGRALRQDERFWTLVFLLQSLTRATPTARIAPSNDEQGRDGEKSEEGSSSSDGAPSSDSPLPWLENPTAKKPPAERERRSCNASSSFDS